MKMPKESKKTGRLGILLMLVLVLAMCVPGQLRVEAASTDVVTIPDAVLKSALNSALGVTDRTADITQGQLATITSLSVGSKSNPVMDLTGIQYCTKLTSLTVVTKSSELDLAMLQTLTKMTRFTLTAPKIKDVSQISACTNIDNLSLYIDSLTELPVIPDLFTLIINQADSSVKTDYSGLAGMTGIRQLYISNGCSDDYSPISELTGLSILSLSGCDITKAPQLSEFTILQTVYFSGCDALTDISGLKGMPASELEITECENLHDLSPLKGMTGITELNLEKATIFADQQYCEVNASVISSLTGLTSLSVLGMENVNDYIDMFDTLSSLETLIVGRSDITDFSFLKNHVNNLKYLNINGCNVGNEVIPDLVQLQNLYALGMGGTQITDFSFIKQFPNLSNDYVRFVEWTTYSRTTTKCTTTLNIYDTTTEVVVKNDVLDGNGQIVAPVASDEYTYDAATNTITIPLPKNGFMSGVIINYELELTTAKGTTLYAAHRKVINFNEYKELTITEQPGNSVVIEGTSVDFSVTAKGEGTLTYQWYKDGTALSGKTESILAFADVKASDAGKYKVVIKDSATGLSLTSNEVTLTVMPKPLVITAQPVGVGLVVGQSGSLSVTASGTAPYTYQWYKDDVAITGATAATYTLSKATLSDAGSYKVVITDGRQQTVTSNTVKVTVKYPELQVTGTLDRTEVQSGKNVVITAIATGGAGGYTYAYSMVNTETEEWIYLNDRYIEENTLTWTAGESSTYAVYVETKDSRGTTKSNCIGFVTVSNPLTVEVETSGSEVCTGDKLTITAVAAGGKEGYTYKYLVYNVETKAWASLSGGYIAEDSFTWTSGAIGTRRIYVDVKDSDGNVVRSNAITVKVIPQPLKISGKSNVSSVMLGDKVQFTATATGGVKNYTYSYLVHNLKTNEWSRVTSFKANSTYTWTAGSLGDREFFVEVKDSTGKVTRSSAMTIKVTPQPLTVTAQSSAAAVIQGDKVTISVSAAGGVQGYTYSYLVYNKTTKEWARLTSFKAANTFTWTAGSVGNRVFYAEVKDSTGKVVRSEAINVEVTPQPLQVSGESSASTVKQGSKVTISATATGGVKEYTYSVLVYNTKTGEWARLTSFKANSTFTWTAGSAGTRRFYVEVKDSEGTVVRSSAITVKVQ